jgi:hypothetical protein
MRIGSLIAVSEMNEEGQWILRESAAKGTVIEIHTGCDPDGYNKIEEVTVRWDDGRVDTSPLSGESASCDWELTDITPLVYANLYLHDRAYGGCEEGGWWYDTYAPADNDWNTEPPPHGHLGSPESAKKAVEALKAWCNEENRDRRSPSSVLSEGHFVVILEAWPAEHSPSQRPHYC